MALILAYEHIRQAIAHRSDVTGLQGSANLAKSSLMRRSNFSRAIHPPLMQADFAAYQEDAQGSTGRLSPVKPSPASVSPKERVDKLEALAAGLRAQLQTIESLIEGEKASLMP